MRTRNRDVAKQTKQDTKTHRQTHRQTDLLHLLQGGSDVLIEALPGHNGAHLHLVDLDDRGEHGAQHRHRERVKLHMQRCCLGVGKVGTGGAL